MPLLPSAVPDGAQAVLDVAVIACRLSAPPELSRQPNARNQKEIRLGQSLQRKQFVPMADFRYFSIHMLRTRLCEMLDIEVPVLAAPMGPEITSLELAAAVSNAGGLGIISFGGYPPSALEERIRKLRSLTSRPFGVNIILNGPQLPVSESVFVEACIEERVPVLSFFWGDPTPYVEKAHRA